MSENERFGRILMIVLAIKPEQENCDMAGTCALNPMTQWLSMLFDLTAKTAINSSCLPKAKAETDA